MAIALKTPVITTVGPANYIAAVLPTYLADDVWVAVIQVRAPNSISAPSDWTQIANARAASSSTGPRVGVYYRVPNGTETPTATFIIGGSGTNIQAVVYPLSGIDINQVVDGSPSENNSSTAAGTVLLNGGVTTYYANSFLFNIQAANNSTIDISFTQPAGWTKDIDLDQTYNDLNVNYTYAAAIGPTGQTDGSIDTSSRWVSIVFALKDADAVSTNAPPVVSVGSGKVITEGSIVTLSVTHDDPEGDPVTFLWEKLSGPVGHTFSNATAETTEVSGLITGEHQFRCTVTDRQGAYAFDELTVTVLAATDYKTIYVFVDGAWRRRRLFTYRNGVWE